MFFFTVLESFETLGVCVCVCFFFSSFLLKVLKLLIFLFSGIVQFTIMASTFDARSIEKVNGNNFHTWKMKMEFFLHEFFLCEIIS